jgi:hypothetical protein
MKIRALIDGDASEAQFHWRVHAPFKHLAYYENVDTVNIGDNPPTDTDIVVLPKLQVDNDPDLRKEAKEYIDALKAQGTVVVYDADDDMWSPQYVEYYVQMTTLYKETPQIIALIDELCKRAEGSLWVMNQCDAVTVSTGRLAVQVNKLLDSAQPVVVVPNAIDVDAFEASIDRENLFTHPYFTTIGWSGGSRPLNELEPMLQAWARLATEFDKVRFVIGGWQPDLTDYPTIVEKLVTSKWLPINKYGTNYSVDIGCVCVGNTDFSLSKSPIKAWEFALADALVVGSQNVYQVEPILVCNDTEDWYKFLKYYILNIEEREALAESYKKHVKAQHDLKYNWLYWMDAYSKIQHWVKGAVEPKSESTNDERATV